MRELTKEIVDALSSFKLSVAILFGLFLITLFGTLYQAEFGLYAAQKRYFESWILLQDVIGPIRVPLPGGFLLMSLLFVNILVGGIVRLRHSWKRAGILIAHIGIVIMLAAGFVKFFWSVEGGMRLYEGQRSSEFVSFHNWEIAVTEDRGDGSVREFLIPDDELVLLRDGDELTFRHPELPFALTASSFIANAEPLPKGPRFEVDVPVVDGYFLKAMPPRTENETNIAGCYVEARPEGGGAAQSGILWGASMYPWTVDAGDRRFAVELRKRRHQLPFSIHLEDFTHEFHPGTESPKLFMSDIVVADGDELQPVRIEMNDPLRRDGVIVFQSNWGPEGAGPGDRLFSGFSIVLNPSDQWPLVSCIVIAIGLLIHFARVLLRYIAAETEVRKT